MFCLTLCLYLMVMSCLVLGLYVVLSVVIVTVSDDVLFGGVTVPSDVFFGDVTGMWTTSAL